jgi:ferritin-like metal-binding protein YciE
MQLGSLQDVFISQIQDLLSAETQLIDALPKMAGAAHDEKLRSAFEEHLGETHGHVDRLREIVAELGAGTGSERCEGMAGLIREGEEIISASGDPMAKDAALIAAAQRVEHYEIAGYGTARTLAGELGFNEARDALDQTLDEESDADKLLTKIATGGMLRSGINQAAAT